jgi:beta-glucosidase
MRSETAQKMNRRGVLLLVQLLCLGQSAAPSLLFGVASSAFQVEGWPADSSWLRWSHIPGHVWHNDTADRSTEFWRRWPEDLALAEELGATMFRFSVAWERVMPQRDGPFNESAMVFYENWTKALLSKGITPVVTILHSVLPVWLEDGILTHDLSSAFTRYALEVVRRLSAVGARHFLTFNEPTTFAEGVYIDGTAPNGHHDRPDLFLRAIYAQADAHVAAVKAIRSAPNVTSGVLFSAAQDWEVFQASDQSIIDRFVASVPARFYDKVFLDRCHAANTLDFVGINYYTRLILGVCLKPPFICARHGDGPIDDMGTESYPAGIAIAIQQAYDRYKLPVMITENGCADAKDALRPDFLRCHISALLAAAETYPVIGYNHWSLTDNFEWTNGYSMRFGLVQIDFSSANKTRVPRGSFYVYQRLIREAQSGKLRPTLLCPKGRPPVLAKQR